MRQNQIKKQKDWICPQKARIIARLMGDGAVYLHKHDYTIKYEVIDNESLQGFAKDIESVYGLKTKKGWNKSGKTGKLIPLMRLRSKKAYEDLLRYGNYDSKSWRVPQEIYDSKQKVKIEFLKAFYGDEEV